MNAKILGTRSVLACLLAAAFAGSPAWSQTQAAPPDYPGGYSIVQRGPHSRLWQNMTLVTNTLGIVSTNIQSYTELRTGLCYLQNGEYADSAERIDIVGAGAEASQGPCKVQWAPDASTAGGAVKLTSPGGQQFASRVYGLALRDVSTGSNVLIAQITNSTGVLTGDNEIVYPSAFSGLQADIQDIYWLWGFQQNVILRAQLPDPSDYGLNPASTCLDVLTEFFSPAVPRKTTVETSVETNGVSDDVNLDFGDVSIGLGGAFVTPDQSGPARVDVIKHWETLEDGRVFLIEETPYPALTNLLQGLPLHGSTIKPGANARRMASLRSLPPDGNSISKSPGAIKVAKATARGPGVTVDYSMLTGSLTNYVFQSDTTYYVSGTVDLYGTNILEGGTVIKYTNTAGASLTLLDAHGSFVFNTYPYRMAVFSSANDNSAGVAISGSTGTPSTGLAMYLSAMNTTNSNALIEHARFSYAGTAFWSQNDLSHIFKHCQFVQCATNVALHHDSAVTLENILSSGSHLMLAGYNIGVNGENMTVDSCTTFAVTQTGVWGNYHGGLTNCVLTAVDSSVNDFTLSHAALYASGSGLYQPVGGAGYYLAAGSTNRAAGTSTIDPALLTDLESMTTYPPEVVAAGWIATNVTFFPQAQRDTGANPDLGYHYYPLDWALNEAVSNATVTVLPGTALAAYGYEYGLWLYTNGILNSQGTATSPNYFVRYNTAQEQSNTNWESTAAWQSSVVGSEEPDSSTASFAFTDWAVLGSDNQFYGSGGYGTPVAFQNCQFYGGAVSPQGEAMAATNCLFRRVNVTVTDVGGTESQTFYNNLFQDGELNITHVNGGIYTFRDNLLDEAVFTLGSFRGTQKQVDICSNNAYVTTNYGVVPPGNGDKILTNSPAYQAGALGLYYYPTNLSLIIHAGSQLAAAAGLYHYTVTTNNAIEGTNVVSIGFHYVAVGSNGLPLDTNGDGIPDYLEDANGNGVVDSGEIDWQVAGDLGLTVVITRPANNATVP